MPNPRVHELSVEMGVEPSVVMDALAGLGVFPRSVSSTISPPVARKLRAALEAEGLSTHRGSPTLPDPIGRAALIALAAGYRSIPELVRLIVRAVEGRASGQLLASAVAAQVFYVAEVTDGLEEQTALKKSELIAPAGVAVVHAASGTVDLLGWRTFDDRLETVLSRLDSFEGALVLVDYHASRSIALDDEYRLIASDRQEGISILAKLFASVPQRAASGGGKEGATGEPKKVTLASGVGIEYVTRGGVGRADHHGARRTARWEVRGHYRNQWFPSQQSHQRIWIAPHAAGPLDGNPLVRDLVRVIDGRR
jgi:hypothetical protein